VTTESRSVSDTTGYNFVEYFDTTGCRKSPRDYSRQYERAPTVTSEAKFAGYKPIPLLAGHMETTRHYTATVYVVCDGATALHQHDKLGIRIPPGGHVHQDELPHEAGIREVREEIGQNPTLVTEPQADALTIDVGEPLPQPRYQMLYDIDVLDGEVAHQHIDQIYFAQVESREIDPAPGEAGPEQWTWYTNGDLQDADLDSDVVHVGCEAIETVAERDP
jgi:8-oxo-dGTP pyrophosphatase MutT (NUDIX family)